MPDAPSRCSIPSTRFASSSKAPAPGVTAVRTSLSEDATFACLKELFPVESAQDVGKHRLRLSDDYGIATFVDGILLVAPSDQLDGAVARVQSAQPKPIPPWLKLAQGETLAFRFVPKGIPQLLAIGAWVSTATDGFALRMRSEMDSAESASRSVEQFVKARGLLHKVRDRYPPEVIELLRGAEFSSEGNVLIYRMSVRGDRTAQTRVLSAMMTLAKPRAQAPPTH